MPVSTPSGIQRVTVLPASPFDGQVIALAVDLTGAAGTANGSWMFRYDANIAGSYKWAFLGGGPMAANVDTDESFTATAYGAGQPATGMSITLPLAGIYVVTHGCCIAPALTQVAVMSYAIGATAASDNDYVRADANTSAGVTYTSVSRTNFKTVSSASTALTAKFSCTAGTQTVQRRHISAVPQIVG